jgi:hypothetical protein
MRQTWRVPAPPPSQGSLWLRRWLLVLALVAR